MCYVASFFFALLEPTWLELTWLETKWLEPKWLEPRWPELKWLELKWLEPKWPEPKGPAIILVLMAQSKVVRWAIRTFRLRRLSIYIYI